MPIEESAEKQVKTSIEYMLVRDISGQMTQLEVPILFNEIIPDEAKINEKFL